MGVLVEFDVGEVQSRAARLLDALAGPPKHHPQPSDNFFQAERLGHVVVAAERQTSDFVLKSVAGGEEERGRVDTVGTQPAQDAEAVHARHHHVEDDGVGAYLTGLVEGGGPVGGGIDLEALKLEAHREKLDDVGLIVDNENSGLWDVFWECSHGHRLNVSQVPVNEGCRAPVNFL